MSYFKLIHLKHQGKTSGGSMRRPGFIEFKDFVVAVHLVQSKLPNERELSSALHIFDKESPGFVNKETLRGILIRIGDILPEEEVLSF